MNPSPVVVELFESQGCSSCPPSESVMTQLKNTFGNSVLLLSFHVDYWDSLGWKDPFSSPAFTNRQRDYAQRLSQDSLYTPEMIVQGQIGFVGSDARRAETEVRAALPRATAVPSFSVSWPDAHRVQVTVHGVEARYKKMTAVLVQDAASVHVLRGENQGVTMSGEHAVRALADVPIASDGTSSVTLPFPGPRGAEPWQVTVLFRDADGRLMAALPQPLPPAP